MTGYEEQLLARAEMLEETGDLAQAVAEVLTGAQGAGVDPRAVTSLTAALRTHGEIRQHRSSCRPRLHPWCRMLRQRRDHQRGHLVA